MFTKKLEDQFSADLLNTVKSILGEAKHDKECECEKCEEEDDEDEDEEENGKEDKKKEMKEGKTGLWANIHAKRKRIKAGSGERMRKPGSKGAPTDADFKAASESVEIEEAENKTGLPKSTAEKNKQYIEITHLLGHKRRVPVHPTNAYKALNRYRNDPSTKSARIVSEEIELEEGKMKDLVTKHMDAGHDYETALKKAKRDLDVPFEGPYKKPGVRKDQYGNVVKNVAKHLAKKAMAKEEVEQIDELSKATLSSYAKKAVNQTFSKGVAGGMGLASSNKEDEASGHRQVNKAAKRMMGAQKAISKLTKEEQDFIDALNGADIEQIDELSDKALVRYDAAAKDDVGRLRRKADAEGRVGSAKRAVKDADKADQRVRSVMLARKKLKGIAKVPATRMEEVELEEGRGRPPKEGSAAWHAKQQKDNDDMPALGVQLRKAKSMNKKVRFMDGKEHEIHPNHADRFEDHMAARKSSQEKAAFQKQAHKSHADFVKAVSAPVPKASKDTGEIVKYRH